MHARDDYDKMGKGLNQQIYLGVVLLGAGALRCGACGCWCSWEIKRLKSHSPAIQYSNEFPHPLRNAMK